MGLSKPSPPAARPAANNSERRRTGFDRGTPRSGIPGTPAPGRWTIISLLVITVRDYTKALTLLPKLRAKVGGAIGVELFKQTGKPPTRPHNAGTRAAGG